MEIDQPSDEDSTDPPTVSKTNDTKQASDSEKDSLSGFERSMDYGLDVPFFLMQNKLYQSRTVRNPPGDFLVSGLTCKLMIMVTFSFRGFVCCSNIKCCFQLFYFLDP